MGTNIPHYLLFVASKVLVYIHGGMWQLGSKRDSLFMARPFNAHGITVAAVGYSLAPAGMASGMACLFNCE